MNDMYIDTTTFDFNQLVDVVEGNAAPTIRDTVKAAQVGPDGGAVEDASDLNPWSDEVEETEEAPEEKDINSDVSDLVTPEDNTDKIRDFNDFADDVILDFGGVEMTKAEARQFFAAKKEYDENYAFVNDAAKNIEEGNRHILKQLAIRETFLEKQLRELNQAKKMGGLRDDQYRMIDQRIDSTAAELHDLNTSANELMTVYDLNRQQLIDFRIRNTDQAMRKEYPDWESWKPKLKRDLEDRGIDFNELEKVWSPQIAKMALESCRFRKNQKVVSETTLAKRKGVHSQASATQAAKQEQIDTKTAEKKKLIAKAKNGGLTREENAKMFDFLVD